MPKRRRGSWGRLLPSPDATSVSKRPPPGRPCNSSSEATLPPAAFAGGSAQVLAGGNRCQRSLVRRRRRARRFSGSGGHGHPGRRRRQTTSSNGGPGWDFLQGGAGDDPAVRRRWQRHPARRSGQRNWLVGGGRRPTPRSMTEPVSAYTVVSYNGSVAVFEPWRRWQRTPCKASRPFSSPTGRWRPPPVAPFDAWEYLASHTDLNPGLWRQTRRPATIIISRPGFNAGYATAFVRCDGISRVESRP